jgi:Protein of unknown function (DUF1236)
MLKRNLLLGALALMSVASANAQGVTRGAEEGARRGNTDAGPVGAAVGAAVGGVVGGVNGLLGIDDRPRFHRYAIEQRRPSYHYNGSVAVGAVLPESGVTYYDVPEEYHVQGYRYTMIDGTPVLVDPRSRTIVEVID